VLAGFGAGEHSENGPCDNHIFVRANDANLDMALVGGNDWLAGCVPVLVKMDAEKPEPFTNARADRGCVLADAPRKDERVQPADRSGKGANPLLDLVAKERNGVGGPNIARLAT
jgi:hypothetical protein